MTRRSTRLASALTALALAASLAACGSPEEEAADAVDPDALTVYSGRNEGLVADLYAQFTEETGIPVNARYANSAELAAQLLEEGDASQVDVFVSQDAGALGALTQEGLFAELPQDTLERVPAQFRAEDGTWVGLSGRARVLAYDPDQVDEADVPRSVFDLTDPQWEGEVGYAPTNASFQAFVTAMRVLEGDDATRQWLEDMQANGWEAYENNIAVLDAVDRGEVQLGLINHYYWYERVEELGEDQVNARLAYLEQDDPGALVNVAGAGVLANAPKAEQAQQFVDFLLSEEAQAYFAENTQEYPLIEGVEAADHLPPLEEVAGPEVDLSQLDSLQETLAMLEEVGLT